MFYDRVAWLLERKADRVGKALGTSSDLLVSHFRRANVFHFAELPPTFADDHDEALASAGGMDLVASAHALPFPVTAIHAGWLLCLLVEHEGLSPGMDHRRGFVLFSGCRASRTPTGDSVTLDDGREVGVSALSTEFDHTVPWSMGVGRDIMISFGAYGLHPNGGEGIGVWATEEAVTYIDQTDSFHALATASALDILENPDAYAANDVMRKRIINEVIASALTASYIGLPSRFILEVAASDRRASVAPGRLRRLRQQATYVVKTPAQIRTLRPHGVEVDAPAVASHAGHWRRRHFHVLRHERFRWKRGRLVPVSACWVGPTEFKDEKGRDYRVLIER